MSGRTTPAGGERPPSVSSLRERSPLMWWVAVIVVIGLVVGTFGGALVLLIAG
jgi:hypothetical protein